LVVGPGGILDDDIEFFRRRGDWRGRPFVPLRKTLICEEWAKANSKSRAIEISPLHLILPQTSSYFLTISPTNLKAISEL
jgi:hypothetical protein